MRRLAHLLIAATPLALAACGGSGSGPAATMPYALRWSGVVHAIQNGLGDDALHPEITVGDAFFVNLPYDPALLPPGEDVFMGKTYDGSGTGLTVRYEFSSGAVYERAVTSFRVRVGDVDDFQVFHVGGTGVRLMDPTSAVFVPLTPDFEVANNDLYESQAVLEPLNGTELHFAGVVESAEREIVFGDLVFEVTKN